ncbi:hypothetical protein QAD02_010400 [Eretmocerus hayati]|uniref:Uncharacterized protein n=1 Tax=Eretmocerus hayati TaxID=131215 RepID=A0ACC2NCD7_9HYME|nr:hypothetical protein QAD02_010400 [Eretmocerus hayati]
MSYFRARELNPGVVPVISVALGIVFTPESGLGRESGSLAKPRGSEMTAFLILTDPSDPGLCRVANSRIRVAWKMWHVCLPARLDKCREQRPRSRAILPIISRPAGLAPAAPQGGSVKAAPRPFRRCAALRCTSLAGQTPGGKLTRAAERRG